MQPGTPAPTPPQSPAPKPKKQQYQTDPTRPFVFPYSRDSGGLDPTRLVPYAIDEADKLYNRHVYVSLGLHQMWETREDLLREERGLGVSGLIGFGKLGRFGDDEDEEEDEALTESMRRDWKYEEEEMECARNGDMKGRRAAMEKRASNKRLYRVEVLYVSVQSRPEHTDVSALDPSSVAKLCSGLAQASLGNCHSSRPDTDGSRLNCRPVSECRLPDHGGEVPPGRPAASVERGDRYIP